MPKISPVTIEDLARLKGVSPDALARFGLENAPEGVLFRYLLPDGGYGRTRLRSALRGADGSAWYDPQAIPITAYSAPATVPFDQPNEVILVEGESDCWAGWLNSVRVIGIPGSENIDALTPEHLRGAQVAFIQVEPVVGLSKTYPQGVEAYVTALRSRLQMIGFVGEVRRLYCIPPWSDISEMYLGAGCNFSSLLAQSKLQSEAF